MERSDRRICNGITKELAKLYTNKSSLSNKVLEEEYKDSQRQADMFFELKNVNRNIARMERRLVGLENRDKRITLRTKRQANPTITKNKKLRQASYAGTGPKRQKDIKQFVNTPPYLKDLIIDKEPVLDEVEY